jgi:hypothetical protein
LALLKDEARKLIEGSSRDVGGFRQRPTPNPTPADGLPHTDARLAALWLWM